MPTSDATLRHIFTRSDTLRLAATLLDTLRHTVLRSDHGNRDTTQTHHISQALSSNPRRSTVRQNHQTSLGRQLRPHALLSHRRTEAWRHRSRAAQTRRPTPNHHKRGNVQALPWHFSRAAVLAVGASVRLSNQTSAEVEASVRFCSPLPIFKSASVFSIDALIPILDSRYPKHSTGAHGWSFYQQKLSRESDL